MSISSLKNNPAALLNLVSQLAGGAQGAAKTTQGQGMGKLDNALQLLQSVTQLAGALQKLQAGLNGQDGFSAGAKPAGASPAAGGAPGAANPVQQLGEIIKGLLQALQGGQTAGQGAPAAGGQAPAAGGQAPAAGGQAPMQGGPAAGGPAAGGQALPFDAAAGLLSNLKEQQGALLGKIAEGVSKGTITPKELGQLMQGVQQLAQATKAASADGKITTGEAMNLSKLATDNVLNLKSSFENGAKAPLAALNPMAQAAAQQLTAMSQGVQQGRINNAELGQLAQGQGALADAASKATSFGDAAKLQVAQQLLGAQVQLARLGNVSA